MPATYIVATMIKDTMTGLFITFEGTEGCGKSTQIDMLASRLQQAKKQVLQTREPGGTQLGEAIRNLLQHDAAGKRMTPEAELLLFTASRAQLVRESIIPAIVEGKIVLCDRFMDSTAVYQGVARKIDSKTVARINEFAMGGIQPDLTVLIDIAPEIGMARIKTRSQGQLDRIEQEALEFFQAVRNGYLKLASTAPNRFLVLDGTQPIDTLQNQIWDTIRNRYADKLDLD